MTRTRRTLAATAAAAVLATTGVAYAAEANAMPVTGCEDVIWFMPFQSTRRAICDGPLQADGSWMRARVHYTPEHYLPATTNCYGTYYISCTTTGGYWVDYSEASKDIYPVSPATVLPTEPGHLVNNVR